MKDIRDFDYNNKTVILRCDFNVSIKNGKIISDERIKASLKTINYLIENNAKVVILSHLGKVKTKEDKKKNSLFIVYERLCELLNTNVYFSSSTKGKILEDKIKNLKYGEILLVENTRYEDLEDKKESNASIALSKYWASLGDIFINDAFGMTHRKHASNYGISKYLPSARGFLILKELEGLDKVINPNKPFTIFMGGAKVEDKLDVIKSLLPKCDFLLLGGGIANSFLGINHNIGASLTDESKYSELKKLYDKYKEKIILPVDVHVLNNNKTYVKDINNINNDDIIYDIGTKTLNIYKEYIMKSKTIFINGTAGLYEDKRFETGTKKTLLYITRSAAYKVLGGGDALSSANYFKIKGFDFLSTGGGATLEYLAKEKLMCEDKL